VSRSPVELVKMNRLTIRLPDELLDRLRERSRLTGIPMSRMVRQSLEDNLFSDKEQNWKALCRDN
jgi:predicted transcriptional regulator